MMSTGGTAEAIIPPVAEGNALHDILWPIRFKEVAECLPSSRTAPLWRKVPVEILAGLFNLFNAYGRIPDFLIASRTIFVSKNGDPECLGSYRPILIASVAVRHYHRKLARRLEKLALVDIRHRAFRRADGIAENIFLLEALLGDARSSCKGLCMASLDLSKTFDTVSHESITSALRSVGLDHRFVDYVRGMYAQSGTFFQYVGQCSRVLRATKGVRQGDPLSPLLFNLVVDNGLRAIPDAVGYSIGNALAFADDCILMAATLLGLQIACE